MGGLKRTHDQQLEDLGRWGRPPEWCVRPEGECVAGLYQADPPHKVADVPGHHPLDAVLPLRHAQGPPER